MSWGSSQAQPGWPQQGAGSGSQDTVRLPQGVGPDPRSTGRPPHGASAPGPVSGGTRQRDTGPGGGRRPEAAFEDTQAMLAAQARDARSQGDATELMGTRSPGNAGGRGRRARGGRGAGGPAGPTGPGGRGPGDGDGDGDDKPGRTGWKRFLPSWKIVVASFVILSAGVFGMIAIAYANTPIPKAEQADVDDQGSVIYYGDGKTVLARLGVKRVVVTIDKIPRHVQDAVIAAENRSFREDNGIDFKGMLRSAWSTVSGTQVQGASTITQQMVRNYYDGLSQERSVKRKITEIFVAIKVDKTLSKDQILQQYLNTIYFGRGAYGIQAAAQAFFRKNVDELTPEQGAYLAGRIQNPDAFDKAENSKDLSATQRRYDYVIKGMAAIDPPKYGSLPAKSPTAPKRITYQQKDYYQGIKGYMITEVLKELKSRSISQEDVERGGFKIYSTFDKDLMIAAKKAVQENTSSLSPEIHTGLAAVDPRNGRVIAFYGGPNFVKREWNDAFMSEKQAASAFKPYVLAAWLEEGNSLNSYLLGKGPITAPGTNPIKNSHDIPGGSVNTIRATAESINTAFVQMGEEVGLDKVIEIAAGAGISEKNLKETKEKHSFALTIGSGPVTPVQQAGGYSIFANEGKHFQNHVVIKVVGRDKTTGKKVTVLKESSQPTQVISRESAADAIVALQQVVKDPRGTGRAAALSDRPVAGKTGTNDENKEAWFVGFTPQLSTAVGMYRQDKKTNAEETLGDIQGATYPTRVWHAFMVEAMKGQEVMQFPPRANVGSDKNLAPKPEPTPTPTTDDPFDTDDPGDLGDDGFPNEDGTQTPPPGEGECVPGDISCDSTGEDTGDPDGGDIGTSGGAAIDPNPRPSGRRP
ncbi:transglycosylase domain-containing protein [Streptosporangium sp. NPDC000396]|uniref:transglycosylase domain-containing protein n=1 Tax=Streptosporangium sp. NPDC000396 TaxID=3366185 RepID=UPI0036A7FE02